MAESVSFKMDTNMIINEDFNLPFYFLMVTDVLWTVCRMISDAQRVTKYKLKLSLIWCVLICILI